MQEQERERPYVISFRVSDAERTTIRRAAKALRRSPSAIMRLSVLALAEQVARGRRTAPEVQYDPRP
jgi:uncharacterized protein (DUF1778 family)